MTITSHHLTSAFAEARTAELHREADRRRLSESCRESGSAANCPAAGRPAESTEPLRRPAVAEEMNR